MNGRIGEFPQTPNNPPDIKSEPNHEGSGFDGYCSAFNYAWANECKPAGEFVRHEDGNEYSGAKWTSDAGVDANDASACITRAAFRKFGRFKRITGMGERICFPFNLVG